VWGLRILDDGWQLVAHGYLRPLFYHESHV
jgi:hypothetical protein